MRSGWNPSTRHSATSTWRRHRRQAGVDPVLINMSFNTRGEPLVNSAEDAVRSAEALGVDFLVVGEEPSDLP